MVKQLLMSQIVANWCRIYTFSDCPTDSCPILHKFEGNGVEFPQAYIANIYGNKKLSIDFSF